MARLMSVAFSVGWDFATEKPVDDSKVHQRQAHADGPPGEADTQRVWARDGASDGEVVALRSDCGEKYGEKAGGGADHHGSEIAARSEEGWKLRGGTHGQAHHGNARDDGQWNEEGDGVAFVVIE